MIEIVEINGINGAVYEKWLIGDSGDRTLIKVVNIWAVNIKNEDNIDVMYLYDTKRQVIPGVFDFMNYYLFDGNKSYNTRVLSLTALKFFFSFIDLFEIDYKDITVADVKKLKSFFYGKSLKGIDISFVLKSMRGADTINSYFSVYRNYYDYLSISNSPFDKKSSKVRKGELGLLGHTRKIHIDGYRENERSIHDKRKIPMYIKIDELNLILKHIRKKYSLREELIVRLMYECGMRIGEVLGLTLEDIETSPHDIAYKRREDLGILTIRNRISDKEYQLAKTCSNPVSDDNYKSKEYNTKNIGFQIVNPTIALLKKIDEYIEKIHGNMSKKKRQNYIKYSKADRVTIGENLSSHDNYYIFLNKNGSPLNKVGWNKLIRQIFLECGLKIDIGVRKHNLNHRFRHGYAMFLKKYQNATELDLMYKLRHSDLSTVQVYFNPDDDDIYKANTDAAESMYELIPELKN